MAQQRGRKPKGNYKQKTEVFSTRIRADTKAALEAAARERGHSLSQEVEYRLRRSFDEDKGLIEKLGGRENYAVLRLISSLMGVMYNPAALSFDEVFLERSWLHDPYLFDQLLKAIAIVLEQLRPPGSSSVPPVEGPMGDALEAMAPLQGVRNAARLLAAVKDAPPDLPLSAADNPVHPAVPFIRHDLGAVGDRIGNQEKGRGLIQAAREERRVLDDTKRTADEIRRRGDARPVIAEIRRRKTEESGQ
jgi:hypothetical protein